MGDASSPPRRVVFGESPLPETVELAALLRAITNHALALEQPTDTLRELVGYARNAEEQLRNEVPPNLRPRIADRDTPDRRVYLDHARNNGSFNAAFPVYELRCDHNAAEGTVQFPIAYEGPPGVVHGGFVALLFDCVLQQLSCDLGTAGTTVSIEVRYLRPTPLLRTLTIAAQREDPDKRIHSRAQLLDGDQLLAEAHMISVDGSPDSLPAVSPRRSA